MHIWLKLRAFLPILGNFAIFGVFEAIFKVVFTYLVLYWFTMTIYVPLGDLNMHAYIFWSNLGHFGVIFAI